ncbi:MAG: MFS transporter [Rhodoglobus sp.]
MTSSLMTPNRSRMTRDERLVLTVAILASSVAFLDGSAITVILPAISRELGGGISTQQWVIAAYLITLSILILLARSLIDFFGRVAVLRTGLVVYGIASLMIVVAPTAELVIALRAIQGISGALLVPSSLALIMWAFRDDGQPKAISIWTAWTSVSFLVGPLLAGVFADYLSWRLVFALSLLPIALTLMLLMASTRTEARSKGAHSDLRGGLFGIAALGGFVFAIIEQNTLGGGDPRVFLVFGLGLVSLAFFIWWERKAPAPLLPWALFRRRNFSWGNLATFLIYAAVSLGGFSLVIFLQQVAGYSAVSAALAFLPVALGNVFLSRLFDSLSAKFGPRLFMTIGPVIAGGGYLIFLTMGDSVNYWWQVLPGAVVFAVGISVTVAPLTSAILGSIPSEQRGTGSAINNAIARIAGLIAIAAISVIVPDVFDLAGFHRVVMVAAGLLFLGGIVSLIGVHNPLRPARDDVVPLKVSSSA